VEILRYRETETRHYVDAEVHVETDGQKAIIIGKKGSLIKKIQNDAARDLQQLTGVEAAVMCHVKVSPRWRNNDRFLREMGFFAK
jgi:GTP-binding protein Era